MLVRPSTQGEVSVNDGLTLSVPAMIRRNQGQIAVLMISSCHLRAFLRLHSLFLLVPRSLPPPGPTTDTFGVGTRMAMPLKLPPSSENQRHGLGGAS